VDHIDYKVVPGAEATEAPQPAPLHSFGGIPIAGERFRQPVHFGARASFGLRDRTF